MTQVQRVVKFCIPLNTKFSSSFLYVIPTLCTRLDLPHTVHHHKLTFQQTCQFSHLAVKPHFDIWIHWFCKPAKCFDSIKMGRKCKNKLLMNFVHTDRTKLLQNNTDTSMSKCTKHLFQRLPFILDDNMECMPSSSIEKQILDCLHEWQLQKAVNLLKISLKSGVKPDIQVIFRLLQHFSSLGEVNCLLEMNDILKSNNISFGLEFYKCLHMAYCISGKIEESIAMLREMYESASKSENVDVFFYLLTTKIIIHFPHRINIIKSLVDELQKKKLLLPYAQAYLWCSFVQAEKFSKADGMLQEDKDLKKFIPAQVTKLVQLSNELEFDRDKVLLWILQQSYIKPGLKASVFDALIIHKCKQGDWDQALKYLSDAMLQGLKIHKDTLKVFLSKFLCEFSHSQIQQFSNWAKNQ
ncbi:unnamed protein product [Lymnaea stagnalis]|uniref:Pentatricopeptide repeat-containing protein n=1 Tax=Lymnaea stagnalis TaxID=6523 RepID=A0AAV2IB87_LYMST